MKFAFKPALSAPALLLCVAACLSGRLVDVASAQGPGLPPPGNQITTTNVGRLSKDQKPCSANWTDCKARSNPGEVIKGNGSDSGIPGLRIAPQGVVDHYLYNAPICDGAGQLIELAREVFPRSGVGNQTASAHIRRDSGAGTGDLRLPLAGSLAPNQVDKYFHLVDDSEISPIKVEDGLNVPVLISIKQASDPARFCNGSTAHVWIRFLVENSESVFLNSPWTVIDKAHFSGYQTMGGNQDQRIVEIPILSVYRPSVKTRSYRQRLLGETLTVYPIIRGRCGSHLGQEHAVIPFQIVYPPSAVHPRPAYGRPKP